MEPQVVAWSENTLFELYLHSLGSRHKIQQFLPLV
jgi:hypothetical protein